ncbi:unnamed protein product, partial [Ectocarpus fasciculatus]
ENKHEKTLASPCPSHTAEATTPPSLPMLSSTGDTYCTYSLDKRAVRVRGSTTWWEKPSRLRGCAGFVTTTTLAPKHVWGIASISGQTRQLNWAGPKKNITFNLALLSAHN